MLRRTFLRAGSVTGALLAGGLRVAPAEALARRDLPPRILPNLFLNPIGDSAAIPRFVNALPLPRRIDGQHTDRITIVMRPTVQDVIGGGLGLRTPVWGYGLHTPHGPAQVSYPGPTIVARKNRLLKVNWLNDLPEKHMLPVDDTIHWAGYPTEEGGGVPTVVHLHGGHTEARSDGHAEAWYTSPATGHTGPAYQTTLYRYENSQEAATLWYHDHAIGLTRLNVYAGLAGFYLLRDENEDELVKEHLLPTGPHEREIVLQDRYFYPNGHLAYPDQGAEQKPPPSIITGFTGDVGVVNGVAWPRLDVEPRMYRLRVLNGSNVKTFDLRMLGPEPSRNPWPLPVYQIATDGGFLERPLRLTDPLPLSPAERVDLVVDFTGLVDGEYTLTHDASTDAMVDALPFMKFRVNQPLDRARPVTSLPERLRPKPFRITAPATVTRKVLLSFTKDELNRFKLMLGTVKDGRLTWDDPVTETAALGGTEIWEIYTTMGGTHPIHLHLVEFEVLDRIPFTAKVEDDGSLTDIVVDETRKQEPFPTERGPKDTVQVPKGMVTRVKATFDKPGMYMWHCHILEHEDHEMIRPLEVR
ncbi:spore coat protein A [Kitasatospora sp. GP30]|uniref:multicopper oxidase family protein n=1 Tax=Kitasatospora sp. GP30 TaxID=3035084 RepID=UPI000C6FCE1B|nr:multicopper oxidase domain-containing protein [Kitasatospora sp. GP30]MDH6142139.1 spore coat protein A [Kitasatospora sp. GP30]